MMRVSMCITIQLEGLALPCFCGDWAGRRTDRNCRVYPCLPSSSPHSCQHAQASLLQHVLSLLLCPFNSNSSTAEAQSSGNEW